MPKPTFANFAIKLKPLRDRHKKGHTSPHKHTHTFRERRINNRPARTKHEVKERADTRLKETRHEQSICRNFTICLENEIKRLSV